MFQFKKGCWLKRTWCCRRPWRLLRVWRHLPCSSVNFVFPVDLYLQARTYSLQPLERPVTDVETKDTHKINITLKHINITIVTRKDTILRYAGHPLTIRENPAQPRITKGMCKITCPFYRHWSSHTWSSKLWDQWPMGYVYSKQSKWSPKQLHNGWVNHQWNSTKHEIWYKSLS